MRLASAKELSLPAGGRAEIVAPYGGGVRLWLTRIDVPEPLEAYLRRHGHPIRYEYVPREWPLEAYQNVYALEPGSVEMPSAGRPFAPELVTRLVAGGVHVAPVILHAGVSSPERKERPYPERYRVPAATAQLVNAVHGWGGRVVAVGTTVVRALESIARRDGSVAPGRPTCNCCKQLPRPSCSHVATRPLSSTDTSGTSSATATSSSREGAVVRLVSRRGSRRRIP